MPGDALVDEPAPGPEDTDVLNKYKIAGDIATRVFNAVRDAGVAGTKSIDLCKLGDAMILKETGAVFNKKDDEGNPIQKGISMPTCISINNCLCHNSPLESEEPIILAEGDLVKVDLGTHIDGYIAPVAGTFVVGGGKVTGRKADVLMAAHTCAEVALRMMRPGTKTYDVTDAIQKVCDAFHCTAVEGMLSHSITRNKIDGDKAVIQNPTPQLRKEHKSATVEEHEVYAIDMIVSTGEGKGKEGEQRTTVHKKTDAIYNLKSKVSRKFFFEVQKDFSNMPFTLRACSDEREAKMGVIECVKHAVVEPFRILWEANGEYTAQFKVLCIVMPNGNLRGTTATVPIENAESEHKLEDEALLTLLKTSVGSKSKKKKKAKAAAPADGGDK